MFDSVDGDDRVYSACFCCNALISFDFAKVIGCGSMQFCCCLKQECCCKLGEKPMDCLLGKPVLVELMLCKIGAPCCSIGLKKPEPACNGKGECFCFRNNLSLPPNDDTPLMFALCGLLCYPKQGCCQKFSDAK